jgi:teichuronic acid biosynthesis glycosyltransferase TuaG
MKISVITPAFNSGNYIAQSIEAVQSQTFTDWELIIVDDGSTDNTKGIVEEFIKSDSRIKYIYQANGKQGKARNIAISEANGEYLAFLDSDDLWVPNKLEKQLACILEKKVDLVFTQGWSFQSSIEEDVKEVDTPLGIQKNSQLLMKQLYGYGLPILSVLVKTKVVLNVGGFEEDLRVQNAEDYQLWLKICDAGYTFYGMNERLFYYRVHPNQVTAEDSIAMKQVIWATYLTQFKSIEPKSIRKITHQRINRFLIYGLDSLSKDKLTEIISLYKAPLNNYFLFYITTMLFKISPSMLKKFGYKFLDLKHNI